MSKKQRIGVTKLGNQYVNAMGKFYQDTPKAVFAAVAYSFASRLDGEDPSPADIMHGIAYEWLLLHQNGIVPQEAPGESWQPTGRPKGGNEQ
jgi:hypothetical protein